MGHCRVVILGAILLAHAVAVHGESVSAKVKQGNLRFDQKMYEHALQLYSEALQQRPDRREINYNLANTLYRMDKHREAATELKKVTEAEDSALRRKASYNLGNALFKAGRFQEAAGQYAQVLEKDPGDVDAKYNLELALRKLEEQQKKKSQGNDKSKDEGQSKSEQQNQSQQGEDKSKQDQSQSSPSRQQPAPQEKSQPAARDESRQVEDSRQRQDPKGLSRQDAERLLQAMEAKEREELERQLLKVRRGTVRGRDW